MSASDNFDEAKVPPYTVPDPLVCADGSRVDTVAEWRERRRPELLNLFSELVYGRTPAGAPADMHWAVTSVDRQALNGAAVRKEVTIWFTAGHDGPALHLLVYQPAQPPPPGGWPVFLGLNFFGNHSVHPDPGITLSSAWMRESEAHHIVDHRATEASRGTHADRWQIETVLARGFATATAYYGDLCPDRPDGLTEAVGALFGTPSAEQRRDNEWGAIGIWAWGLSRAMDYLVSDAELDPRRVAVHGHSRLGKTALWAGAQDERFALVISNNSGSAGAKLMRRRYGSSIGYATSAFPFWWCRNYATFAEREDELPIDQHELIALIAPRAVHVGSASEDLRADPRGEFLSVLHAVPVYRLHGRTGLGVETMPEIGDATLGDGLAYHVRGGAHNITAEDWRHYLAFAEKELAHRPSTDR
jgi:hypothetical protein